MLADTEKDVVLLWVRHNEEVPKILIVLDLTGFEPKFFDPRL